MEATVAERYHLTFRWFCGILEGWYGEGTTTFLRGRILRVTLAENLEGLRKNLRW